MCKTFRCTFGFVVLITLHVEVVAGFQLSLPQLPPRLRTLPPPRLKRCHGPLGSLRQIKTTLVCNSFVGNLWPQNLNVLRETNVHDRLISRFEHFWTSWWRIQTPTQYLWCCCFKVFICFIAINFWPEMRAIVREDYNTTDCKHRKNLRNLCRTLSRITKADWSLTAITDFVWVVPPYSILQHPARDYRVNWSDSHTPISTMANQ